MLGPRGIWFSAVALTALAIAPTSSFAAVCSPPGEVVVTDPEGDALGERIDILDIAIQEVVAGLHAGKIIVTMHVKALGSTPSGLWFVSWADASGDNTTGLSMSACEGAAAFSYSYSTPESSESGAPDGGSYDPSGWIEWIIARDKIGSPGDGETFEGIRGTTNAREPLLPGQACLPETNFDFAGPGRYVVGSCLVDVPGARAAALRLGLPTPNPSRGDVSLTLDVPEAMAGSRFEAAVFDMAGRRVRTIESGVAAAGRTMLRWNLRNASGERVRPGTYWARITVGGERRAQTVFVVN
jgi:hypothetical protein